MSHPGVELRPGMLLVASPELLDPNFADAVVLIVDADADDGGALGVVLNRPSQVPVGEVLADWSDTVSGPEVLFVGGPVSPEGALAIGLAHDDEPPVGFRLVFGRAGLLDLDTPVELVADGLDALRIFAGYAGWSPGQLEEEIAEGSWYVVAGEVADVFRDNTEDLWRDVLRRQPGELAWHSTRPVDPQLN